MIIENSRVGMGSSRTYTSASVQQSQTLTRRADMAAVFDLSEEGKSLMEQIDEIKEEEKNQNKDNKDNNEEKEETKQKKKNKKQDNNIGTNRTCSTRNK